MSFQPTSGLYCFQRGISHGICLTYTSTSADFSLPISFPHRHMLRRPEYVCSLRYLGEDDVLDRLTSDCASNGDVPAKVECDCCTECYVSTDDLPTEASLTLPDPTVAKIGETNVPTISPTSKTDIVSGTPTVKETVEPILVVNENQEEAESKEVEGSGSSIPPSSEEPIGDNSIIEETPGARNEIQRGRGDSNDWYELLYEEQIEQIANGQL